MKKDFEVASQKEVEIVPCARRVRVFRTDVKYKGYSIETSIHHFTPGFVIVKALILDKDRSVVSSGHSACKESDLDPFHVKYIETAETSAISRALAFMDIEVKNETIAGSEEIEDAEQRLNNSTQKEKIATAQKGVVEALNKVKIKDLTQ